MTPEGLQPCILRDYQEDYLRHLQNNRFSIWLACRQAGKCNSLIINQLYCFDTTKISTKIFNHLNAEILKKYYFYIKDNLIYVEIPMFELYNLYCKQTLMWKLKYPIYKLIYRLMRRK
jgi:hypothetical protein